MQNAAHQLADLLDHWRSFGHCTGVALLAESAASLGIPEEDLLTKAGNLVRSTNMMFEECEQLGDHLEHFADAKTAWTRSVFLIGPGWSVHYHQANEIITVPNLALLRAFAFHYDSSTRSLRPNRASIDRIIAELGPIRDFIESEDISPEMRRLLLLKIESVEVLLQEGTVDFAPIISKMAEVLGMFVLIGSSASDPETQRRWAEKAKAWAGNFGSNLTINMMSGVAAAAALQQLGM